MKYVWQFLLNLSSISAFELLLQNGNYDQFEGRVEIKMNGQWGSTSYIHFTPYMADEFCRYLGYNER